jgi:hypothetical protein
MDYMQLAAGDPARLAEANIRQAGESIASLAQPFALLPQFNSLRL